jgi:hypothetical protein
VVLLVAISLFLRVNQSHLEGFREFSRDTISAAVQELKFEGGRAAKANIILSLILGFLYFLLLLADALREVRAFLGSAADERDAKYVLFCVVCLFFWFSLRYVCELERYSEKTRRL